MSQRSRLRCPSSSFSSAVKPLDLSTVKGEVRQNVLVDADDRFDVVCSPKLRIDPKVLKGAQRVKRSMVQA